MRIHGRQWMRLFLSWNWIIFGLGRFGIQWHFPWGWQYDWLSFLWGYAPDDESWWMRIFGVEIWWMRNG